MCDNPARPGCRASFREGSDFTPEGVLEGTHNRVVTAGTGVAQRLGDHRVGAGGDLHDHAFSIPEGLEDPPNGTTLPAWTSGALPMS